MSRDRVAQTIACFDKGLNCAQSVVSAYCEPLDVECQTAHRLASAFGGGLARTGRTCGAVVGALMVIGLAEGYTAGDDEAGKKQTVGLAREFFQRFIARHGTIACKELLHCDLSTPEGMAEAKEKRHFRELCPAFVRSAAEILEELLGESLSGPGGQE